MKPVRLELEGFTAFRDRAVLDFEGRRLFVITGPTGAGKSSLLDAMTWALFGQVPRVGTSVAQLVAQGASSMHVRFEFETRGRRFQIARRSGVKGAGTVRLERRDRTGAWEPLADKTTEVRAHVERLLGMDYATFTRTMVLPQGAFDAFLRGQAAERREILSKLIGLDVYETARQIAGGRASEAKAKAEAFRAQLASLDLATPERIAVLRREEAEAALRVAALAERFDALKSLADRWRAYEAAQRAAADAAGEVERAARGAQEAAHALGQAEQAAERARRAVAQTEADRTTLVYDRAEHEALRVRVALLDQRDAAQRDLDAATAALAAAEAEQASAGTADAEAVRAARQAERTVQQAATKAAAAAGEVGAAAAAAVAAHRRLTAEAAARSAEALAARQEAQATRERARALSGIAERLAAEAEAEREAAAAHAEAARVAKAAARDALTAAKAQAAAERAVEVARTKAEAARRADAAAVASRGLKKGDRCPVCGEVLAATPRHAKGDLDAAERALAEAERERQAATSAAASAAAASAAAEARATASAQAVEGAAARRAAVEEEAAALGARGDLAARAQRESKAAETTEARATRTAQAAERAQQAAQAFAVALGTWADTPPGDAEPAASPAALTRAIEAAATAERAARDAQAALDRATQQRDAAQREEALRGQTVRAARAHQQAMAQRLAGLGVEAGDAPATRRAFEAAEAAARRAATLDAAITEARSACAAAEASAVGARDAAAKARAEAEQRAARLAEQREAERRAHEALSGAWGAVLGDGPPSKAALAEAQRAHQTEEKESTVRLGALRQAVAQAEAQAEQAAAVSAEIATQEARQRLAGELHTELQSNRFVDFLLTEQLELLARDASVRLMQFSTGRYELATAKGDFFVVDHQNGDEQRSVRTLSGGETFLASLALALSLSEHLPEISGTGGAMSLESLFVDEGFGALDAESLDLAVQGLETLAEGNRMVGVISHIEELSERMPSRVHVEKRAHSSAIREDGAAAG